MAVVSLAAGNLERILRRGHSNIVSGLAFRTNRPTELVSVGMDTRCVCWELGTGRMRCAGPARCCLPSCMRSLLPPSGATG